MNRAGSRTFPANPAESAGSGALFFSIMGRGTGWTILQMADTSSGKEHCPTVSVTKDRHARMPKELMRTTEAASWE